MIKTLVREKEKIFLALLYLAVFLSLIHPYSDYDWGWHFRYGQYLLTHGNLLRTDIYSWTMPGYPWINHEWLYDPIFYIVFSTTGYIGSSLVGALICFICFIILTKPYKLKYWHLAIAGFFFSQLIEEGVWQALRSQVVAYLPLAILMTLIVKAKQNSKLLLWLPPLFLVWANLHGTFAFGLVIVAVFFAYYFFLFPALRKTYIWIGLATLVVTLITPFGLGVIHEILKHTNSPYLQNITEWLPIYRDCPYCNVSTVSVYIVILGLAFFSVGLTESLPFLIVALILVYPAINERRNLPVFGLATFPFFLTYLTRMRFDLSRFKLTPYLTVLILLVAIEYNLVNRLPGFHFYTYNENDYCYFGPSCSPGLAKFLVAHPPAGHGFNMYDWGGYFIGKQVPAQLFIDGRMHLWEATDGYMPFADLIAFYYGGDMKVFNSYNFSWVAIPPKSDLATAIESGKTAGLWRVQYQDDQSMYFVRVR